MAITSSVQYASAAAIAGVGGIAGTVYVANKYYDWESISDHLSKVGRPLLGIHELEKWKKIGDRYKLQTNNDLIEGIERTASVEKIKEWCSMSSIEDPKNTDLYRKVATWCTEPLSIAELINKKGKRRSLKTDGAEDKNYWDTKVESYKSPNNKKLINKQNNPIATSAITDTELKSWCKDNSSKDYKYELDPHYLTFVEWCTIPT
ncbi:hypothetical protein HF1_12710 [Mycoplasma haemofelis str. Langford 1]|uniref:Uncharacterized protein n=1 Tax=Mycoplasma haemofelis (strain Langford 1) TaxID=941640 RepID=E8ZJF8_MYCHL|nr:hypothetical protein [Mycoplasma haemofelis]CBY93279.1 hypothetical protein HF1_12710 [Mycoplasma haemofelis str. Langford 1]